MTTQQQDIENFTIAIYGSGGVGKSALTLQFVKNVFMEDYDPTIEESYRKSLILDGKIIELEIIDTAGQEEYKTIRDSYMRQAQGFILVFSLTEKRGMADVEEIYVQILRVKEAERVPVVLVANKCDIVEHRSITEEEFSSFAKQLQIESYFESSAKSRLNVDEAFHSCIRQIRSYVADDDAESTDVSKQNKKKKKKKKGKCKQQ